MALDDHDENADHGLGLADVIAGMAAQGEPIPTGIPFLDRWFRKGGLYAGKLITLVGPPGAGKTTLATMILNSMSPQIPGRGLFVDEGRQEAAVRMGQQLGYSQDDLESGAPGLIQFMAQRLEGTFLLDDPDEKGACVMHSMELLSRQGNGVLRGRLLVVDSAQRVRYTPQTPPGERETIELVSYGMRDECRARKAIGILTSQSAREQYKAKRIEDRGHVLAASAGSRAPEYACDMQITFDIPDENDVVRCEVAKNRMGKRGVFFLKLDRVKAELIEVDASAREESEQQEQVELAEARAEKLFSKILQELAEAPGQNTNQLRQAISARPNDVINAVKRLEQMGKIVCSRLGTRKIKTYDLIP